MIKVFLSHDWGYENIVHEKVVRVASQLRKKMIDVWIDTDNMRRNIVDSMCDGIDHCDVFIVFVTRKYIHKVQFGDDLDNVRREFMYAQSRGKRMIAIKFDDLLPKKWQGPVGMLLGSSLYVDLVDSASQKGIPTLVSTIRKAVVKCQMNSVMTTAQVAVRLRTPSPQRRRPLSPRSIRGKANLTESVTHNNQSETTIKKRLDRAAMLVGITPSTRLSDTMMGILYTLNLSSDKSPFICKLNRIEVELGLVNCETTPTCENL
jgi:hypothetical protein